MHKSVTFAAVAVVGLVGVATWSAAQSPGGLFPSGAASSSSPARPAAGGTTPGTPKSRLTSSADSPGIDSSLAPFRRGLSPESLPSPGSSQSANASILIKSALVTSLDPIKLPARDAGAIRTITVRKGNAVKADDILGQIDDLDSQTKKKIAELERDAAKLQADSDAQVDAAKKGERVTRANLDSHEELNRKSPGALSAFEFRRSQFEWERSLAQIAVAEVEKAVAYATQLAKEGQIDGALIEIERRKIVAPIDGIVTEIYKHKGEWCQPGDPILEIVRMDRVEIEGFVYAADASPAKIVGKPVDVVVQLAGGDTYKASGTITFASPVLEGSGRIRQFRVSTEIDNKKEGAYWVIQPGTEAEMTIHHNPPPPKPVIAPKTGSPAGAKTPLPGTKVEAFKPAIPDAKGKSDAKSDAKSGKADAKSEAKSDATKADSKTESKAGAKGETKPEAKADDKAKSAETKPDAAKAGDAKETKPAADADSKTKTPAAAEKSDKPAEKGDKEPVKSSKIKL